MSAGDTDGANGAASSVVVVGAGIAGTGAALTAAWGGATVTVLDGGAGASTLATGAIDLVPWRPGHRGEDPVAPDVRAAIDAIDAFAVPDEGATILTTAGIVRPARGHDRAVLDVSRLRGRIGVAVSRRAGWDGASLAALWREAMPAALARECTFDPLEVTVTRFRDEDALPDADLAERHDDAARLGWLGERLREGAARAGGDFAAVVLPPILGRERARGAELAARAGLPCGEATGLPGGPSGLRFERARDRAFATAGVRRVVARARSIRASEDGGASGWRVLCEDGTALEASTVILASGGLVGGGLAYSPSDAVLATELPPGVSPLVHLTLSAPVVLGARGRRLELPRSLFGYAPEALVYPFARDSLLDHAGVLGLDPELRTNARLFAAGDVAADQPRSWLGALASGVHAGMRATLKSVTAA